MHKFKLLRLSHFLYWQIYSGSAKVVLTVTVKNATYRSKMEHQCCDLCNQTHVWKVLRLWRYIGIYCKTYKSDNFPFRNIDNNKLLNTMQIKQKDKNRNLSKSIKYSPCCSVCSKRLLRPKHALPCISCEHLVHKKFSWQTSRYIENVLIVCKTNFLSVSVTTTKFNLPLNSNLNCNCANKKANVSLTGKFDIFTNNTSHKDTW